MFALLITIALFAVLRLILFNFIAASVGGVALLFGLGTYVCCHLYSSLNELLRYLRISQLDTSKQKPVKFLRYCYQKFFQLLGWRPKDDSKPNCKNERLKV